MSLKPKDTILKIHPYVQGKSELTGINNPIKLSSNESSFGPCPAAQAAFADMVNCLYRYPDGAQTELREAIAEVYQIPAQQIICGNGSEELIQLLIRAYIYEGDEVLLNENGFLMYNIHALAQGAAIVKAPEQNYRIDVDALIGCVSDRTRIVIIANPNNPTGTYIPEAEVKRLHSALPSDVLLLLDGAYAEYVMRDDYESGINLVAQADNIVMTRTFSKIYGLSGLRIGWAYCPLPIIDILQRIRTPFNTNSAALAAATAAVKDVKFTEKVKQHNEAWQNKFRQAFPQMGIDIIESVANFYLLKFPDGAQKNSKDAGDYLQSKGIIPRPVGEGGDNNLLRITVGTDKENEAVVAALKEYMQS